MANDWGVNHVKLEIEYLGAVDQVFELGRLRAASQPEVNVTLKHMLDSLLT